MQRQKIWISIKKHLEYDGVGDVPAPNADIERLAANAIAIADADRGPALTQDDLAHSKHLKHCSPLDYSHPKTSI